MDYLKVEKEIGLELPSNFSKYDEITQQNIIYYLKQLNSIEEKAYTIGKSHLGSSFNIVKSNGYINWKKTN
jgi:hypothetical protein